MIENILQGAGAGLIYALSGLANKKKKEKFCWKKILPTVIGAGIIGGLAGFIGMDYNIVANMSISAGLVVVLEKFLKAGLKQFK